MTGGGEMTEVNTNTGREIFEKEPGRPLQTVYNLLAPEVLMILHRPNENPYIICNKQIKNVKYFRKRESSFHE
jgi:hypothetical protein